ncbi:MAG: BatA domain-containing protein, partial [Kiloniellaceae bacterium]
MLTLGPLAFAQPWLLLALAGLPLIWLLLRLTPPAPRALRFPAVRLIFGLSTPEETPARTPLWLILLRTAIAALVILGLAQPLLNPTATLSGNGPLVLVIDDGWAAARQWTTHQAAAASLLDRAEREGRSVMVLTTARDAQARAPTASGPVTAAEARRLVRAIEPKPWPSDRPAAIAALEGVRLEGAAHVAWLSDGLDDGNAAALARRLRRFGEVDLVRAAGGALARLVLPPEADGTGLTVRLRRAGARSEDAATVVAVAEDETLVARVPVIFPPGERDASARIDLPSEMRNRIARLTIEGESTAG